MTDWAKRAAIDPLLSDALRGAGMILDLSPREAAEAVGCALRAYENDRAALTVLCDIDLEWGVLDETHLRRMRELMEDNTNEKKLYQRVNSEQPRAVDPEVARLRRQLEEAQEALSDTQEALQHDRERYKLEAALRHEMNASAPMFTSGSLAGAFPGFHQPEPEEPEETTILGNVLREIGKHAAHGAKAELSSQAQKAIVSGVRQLAPQLPKSPVYDAVIAILAPVLLLAAGRVAQEYMDFDEDAFTGKLLAGVTEGAGLALEGTSKETVRSVITGAVPALMQLAAVTRPELAAGGYDDE